MQPQLLSSPATQEIFALPPNWQPKPFNPGPQPKNCINLKSSPLARLSSFSRDRATNQGLDGLSERPAFAWEELSWASYAHVKIPMGTPFLRSENLARKHREQYSQPHRHEYATWKH